MKKLWTMFLVMMLIFSMTVPAFALVAGESESQDINIDVINGASTPTVYYVVVAWESLQFKYDLGGGQNEWDAEDHAYTIKDAANARWSDNDAKVTVTNHSNVVVNIETLIDGSNRKEMNNVVAALDKTTAAIEEADQAAYMGVNSDKAPSAVFTITVSGTPSADDFKLGEVTVEVNP